MHLYLSQPLEVMKSKGTTGRRLSCRLILPTALIAGVLLPFIFIRTALLAVDAGASLCPSISCLGWRFGPLFFRGSDASLEEMRRAFMDGGNIDLNAVKAAPDTLDQLIEEMGSTSSSSYGHLDINAFSLKIKAMLVKMDQKVQSARLRGSVYRYLASIGIPKCMHCLTLMLAEEYLVNSCARSSLPPPEYASQLVNGSCIHIALLTDNVLAASVVVSSALTSSTNPENLVFHIITDKKTYTAMHSWFALNPLFPAIVEVKGLHQFEWSAVENDVVMETVEEIHRSSVSHQYYFGAREEYRRLEALKPSSFSVLNYLRIHLPELFPKLERIIFLDDDVVVRRDLSALWNLDLNGNVNGAVIEGEVDEKGYHGCLERKLGNYVNFSHPIITSLPLGSERDRCAWLSGMNLFDLQAWRRTNITLAYQHWLKLNRESGFKLWRMGSLPPALIAFTGQVQPIHCSWHLSGLGREIPDPELVQSAAVIHFRGPGKPWLEIGFQELRGLWRSHVNQTNEFIKRCRVTE